MSEWRVKIWYIQVSVDLEYRMGVMAALLKEWVIL